jgi:hypothetical protein
MDTRIPSTLRPAVRQELNNQQDTLTPGYHQLLPSLPDRPRQSSASLIDYAEECVAGREAPVNKKKSSICQASRSAGPFDVNIVHHPAMPDIPGHPTDDIPFACGLSCNTTGLRSSTFDMALPAVPSRREVSRSAP